MLRKDYSGLLLGMSEVLVCHCTDIDCRRIVAALLPVT